MLSSIEHFPTKLGRHLNDKKNIQLFHNVVFCIDDNLPQNQKKRLNNFLVNNGGQAGDLTENNVNLYISNESPLYDDKIVSVTPLWVEKAINNGFVHDFKYYVPGKNQFLSGEVLLLLDLPNNSQPILKHIEKYGGQYKDDLEQDITCLICADPRGAHYNECMDNDIPVVLSQWLDDCFRYHTKLDYTPYRFPSPSVYYQLNPYPATIFTFPKDVDTLTSTVPNNLEQTRPFENQVVYFGSELMHDQLKLPMIPVLTNYIKQAGGKVATQYDHHQVTVVILKYRSSLEYKQALKDKKYVASFWWISNTLARGYFCSPLDTLLDYPVPKTGIPMMEDCVIAVTGFKGVSRLFISTLIAGSGARYSPELEKDTTHLICGGGLGSKYSDLKRFPKVARVNHIWLEDCFAHWKKLDWKTNMRYSYIPEDNSLLANTVGKTSLIQSVVDRWKDVMCDAEPGFVYQQYSSGFVEEKKPRQAALRAQRVLNDIVIPDANAYELERLKLSGVQ